MATFTIHPVPPFDFALTSAIFSSGDPQIRIFREGIFRYAIVSGGIPVLAEVHSGGTADRPLVSVTIRSDQKMTNRVKKEAGIIFSRLFSIDDDLSAFYQVMESDPGMADLAVQLRGLRSPTTPTVFEALTDSIIEQQISLTVARGIENRLIRAVGKPLCDAGNTWYTYPDPAILAETSDMTFRSCGLTLRKGEYIRDISRQIVDGNLNVEALRGEPDTESIIEEMTKLRGIGRWTAELTILRGLHRPDAFPADDIAVRRFISRFYLGGRKITSAECRVFAERWGAWKGYAAYYLEVADMLGLRPRHFGI